jgi:hypothetical protein
MDWLQILKEIHTFLISLSFPVRMGILAVFMFLYLVWYWLSEKREIRILRYKEIADTEEQETNHHGEAVTLRRRLRMNHEEILAKAKKVIERNSKLLKNNPVQ